MVPPAAGLQHPYTQLGITARLLRGSASSLCNLHTIDSEGQGLGFQRGTKSTGSLRELERDLEEVALEMDWDTDNPAQLCLSSPANTTEVAPGESGSLGHTPCFNRSSDMGLPHTISFSPGAHVSVISWKPGHTPKPPTLDLFSLYNLLTTSTVNSLPKDSSHASHSPATAAHALDPLPRMDMAASCPPFVYECFSCTDSCGTKKHH